MRESRITFCRICEASCGLIAEVEGDLVRGLKPDPDHVSSRGFACAKGTRYTDVHHSPDRLRRPLKRDGERYVEIGWTQAMKEIGERARAIQRAGGADSLGVYCGNPTPFSPIGLIFAKAFAMSLRTPHVYTAASLDCNNKFVAAESMLGSPMLNPIPDLDHTELLVLIGANPLISNMTFMHAPRIGERLRAIETRGGRVVTIDPRRNETARQIGEHHFIRAGTDVFFLLALTRALLARGADARTSATPTRGLSALRDVVEPWSAERVAPVTGIEPGVVEELADRLMAANGAAVYHSVGVNQGPHGSLCAWLVMALNVITGNLYRRGGMIVTPQMKRNARISHVLASRRSYGPTAVGGFDRIFDCEPVGLIPDQVRTSGPGRLRGLFVNAGNLALAAPDARRMDEALSELDLLVCVDLFRNETARHADYVLPSTSFLERSDLPLGVTGYQPEPYLQLVEPVVRPLGEARDDWWILAQLARVCSAPSLAAWPLRVLIELVVGGPDSRSLAWRERVARTVYGAICLLNGRWPGWVRRRPHGVRLPAVVPEREARGGVFMPGGAVDLCPEALRSEASGLEAAFEAERQSDAGLRLISRRERLSHNSWMHNVPAFSNPRRGRSRLRMHPDDARARGIQEGGRCRVLSEAGSVETGVELDADLMPGTVCLPHGWGHAGADGLQIARRTVGVNFNVLAESGPQSLERLSGMARLSAIPVEVEPLDDEAVG